MDIKLEYNNGYEPFKVSSTPVSGWGEPIIEINVEGTSGRTRKEALTDILVNMEYLFRNLKNMHDTDIDTMEISNCVMGNYIKTKDNVNVTNSDKLFDMIVYSFYSDVFAEKLLFTANSETIVRNKSNLTFQGNVINEKLLSSNNRVKSREFLDSLLVVVKSFLPDYDIRVDEETKKLKYFYKGSALNNIEEIKDDNVFIFFKFVEVLLTKGPHSGYFFIDASVFKSNVLTALVAFINLNFLNNRLVFIYNVSPAMRANLNKIPRDVLTFKNHKIPCKNKK